jgi:hypothetical protein
VIAVYLPRLPAFAFKMSQLPFLLRWVLSMQERRKEGWFGRAAAEPARLVVIALGVMNPPVHPTAFGLVGNWQVQVAFLLGLVLALPALPASLAIRQ